MHQTPIIQCRAGDGTHVTTWWWVNLNLFSETLHWLLMDKYTTDDDIIWLVQLYSNPQQPVEITGSSPGHLSSCVEVQGAHWFQHFYAAHVLKKKKQKMEKRSFKMCCSRLDIALLSPKERTKTKWTHKRLVPVGRNKVWCKNTKVKNNYWNNIIFTTSIIMPKALVGNNRTVSTEPETKQWHNNRKKIKHRSN